MIFRASNSYSQEHVQCLVEEVSNELPATQPLPSSQPQRRDDSPELPAFAQRGSRRASTRSLQSATHTSLETWATRLRAFEDSSAPIPSNKASKYWPTVEYTGSSDESQPPASSINLRASPVSPPHSSDPRSKPVRQLTQTGGRSSEFSAASRPIPVERKALRAEQTSWPQRVAGGLAFDLEISSSAPACS